MGRPGFDCEGLCHAPTCRTPHTSQFGDSLELFQNSLKDLLEKRSLVSLQSSLICWQSRPLNILREGIVARADSEPVLLVGPVIGRVTDTTASFLLEVNDEIDVNISIAQVNGHKDRFDRQMVLLGQDLPEQPSLISLELDRTYFSARSAVCTAQRLRPGLPVTFQLQNLKPDTPYMVFISNIPEAEMRSPLRFRTLPTRMESLRVVVLGDYATASFGSGWQDDSDPWKELQKSVASGLEVQVALQVGRSYAAEIFDQVCGSLREHQSFCEGPRQRMLKEARNLLRESYRITLGGHVQLRSALAQICSNLSVFQAPLDLPTLLQRAHELDEQGDADASLLLGDIHQLLCLGLEVYREYQRSLWDGSFHVGLATQVLGQGWLDVPDKPAAEQEEEDEAGLEYLVDAGAIADSVEEWHIHRYGPATILVLDTKGNAMTAALTSTWPQKVLSEKQWEAIDEALSDEMAQALLLVSDTPLALEEAEPRGVVETNAAAADVGFVGGHRWTMSWEMANAPAGSPRGSRASRGSRGSRESQEMANAPAGSPRGSRASRGSRGSRESQASKTAEDVKDAAGSVGEDAQVTAASAEEDTQVVVASQGSKENGLETGLNTDKASDASAQSEPEETESAREGSQLDASVGDPGTQIASQGSKGLESGPAAFAEQAESDREGSQLDAGSGEQGLLMAEGSIEQAGSNLSELLGKVSNLAKVDVPEEKAEEEEFEGPKEKLPTWRTSRKEQESLLDKIFRWKKAQYGREAVLINGGAACSKGTLEDTRLELSIPVVCAGGAEGSEDRWRWTGELPGKRFRYRYEEPKANHWGLPFLQLDLSKDQVTVDVSVVTGPLAQQMSYRPRTRGLFSE
ncbi:unnamed protein product [Effrenium voratum]|nr:unnamed protein product [Effrenium voratum]